MWQVGYHSATCEGKNPAYDILIATRPMANKHWGFPVRLKSFRDTLVAVLSKVDRYYILEHETKNNYHYHDNDNRILPPHITAEESLTGRCTSPNI